MPTISFANYRCFDADRPISLTLRPGIISVIGANNSGKSAFLRFFYELRRFFQVVSEPTASNFLSEAMNGSRPKVPLPTSVRDPGEIYSDFNLRPLTIEVTVTQDETEAYARQGIPEIASLAIDINRNGGVSVAATLIDGTRLERPVKAVFDHIIRPEQHSQWKVSCKAICTTLKTLANTAYFPAYRNAINASSPEPLFDISTGTSFISQWKNLKTGSIKRNAELAYELTNSIRRILGFDRFEINATENGDSLSLLIDGKSYRLDEVGAGITQFILVLTAAATQKPDWILIDEPELNLHARVQLDFLTTLASYGRSGMIFATHSIGLARAASDRIYSVTKEPDTASVFSAYESTPRLSELLGSLNYAGQVQCGCECVLLVEGTSDVRTFQQWLRILGKDDHSVVILPLGGKSLIRKGVELELQELRRIAPRVLAVVDSERESAKSPPEPSRLEFAECCRACDILCLVTERSATENYFTQAAVNNAKGEGFTALSPFQDRAGTNTWSKSENWRIAREMRRDEILSTDIGKFLADL